MEIEEQDDDDLLSCPWDALSVSREEFVAKVQSVRAQPSCTSTLSGNGGSFFQSVLYSGSEIITPVVCREILGWILAGEDPNKWLKALKEEGCSSTCGHVGLHFPSLSIDHPSDISSASSSCSFCATLFSARQLDFSFPLGVPFSVPCREV